jgi:gas vesicle protein
MAEAKDFEADREYEESSSLGLGVTMLFIGLAAGALVALLLAPTTGKQMRRTLRRKYEDAREVMEDIGEQAGDWTDKGSEWADKAKSKMPPLKRPFGR